MHSRPMVHPVQAPPPGPQAQVDANAAPLGVRMKHRQGVPGTLGGLALRLAQASFAAASVAAMASTRVFPSVSAFRCHPFPSFPVSLSSAQYVPTPIVR